MTFRPGFEKHGMRPPAPEPLLLSGTVPGVLDCSQPSRVLRNPLSLLSFASFDPLTASPDKASSSSSADRCRSKRIVIEHLPEGPTTWRWVPKARKDDGVNDEGDFVNRVVSICGTLYRMTQDQWDIYKLDPQYNCWIKGGTGLPTITLKGPGQQPSPFTQPWASSTASMRPASPHSESNLRADNALKDDATMRTAASLSDYESDDMSVNDDFEFIDDYDQPQSPTTPKRAKKDLPQRSRPYPDFNFTPNMRPMAGSSSAQNPKRSRGRSSGRRKVQEEEDVYEEGTRNTKSYTPNGQKRARTLSPSANNRNLTQAKIAREKAKARRLRQKKEWYKRKRQSERDAFEIPTPVYENERTFADVPEEEEMAKPENGFQPPPAESEGTAAPQPQPKAEPVDEEEAARQRIAESVRKLRELNLNRAQERERESASMPPDTPEVWKQQQARTKAPSNQEEERRKKFEAAMQDELRRKHELEEERRQEALRQQQQEHRRAQLRAKAAHDREIRTKEWDERFYDHPAAVDRYRQQAVFFDKEKFTAEENPLLSLDIPWPTLTHPLYIRAEHLEFDAVIQFLEVAKMCLPTAQYNSMVAKSRL